MGVRRNKEGRRLCAHGRARRCKMCGRGYCEHGRINTQCKDCGTGYCKHGRLKSRCRFCGTGHCEHRRIKGTCQECGGINTTFHLAGQEAKKFVKKFLSILQLKENYDISKIVKNFRISNTSLEKITKGNGWPDFKKECLEEKGPKIDCLGIEQLARAILEYRFGHPYRVAWRFTSTKRKLFKDIFMFYKWQLNQRTIKI